jgi:hypothetical protein
MKSKQIRREGNKIEKQYNSKNSKNERAVNARTQPGENNSENKRWEMKREKKRRN